MPGAKVVGNRGHYLNGVSGVGKAVLPDGTIGWNAVVGKSGDVAYLAAASVHSNDRVQQGYYFQSGAGATVDFTLANANMATDASPGAQDNVQWANTLTVANDGTIVKAEVCFTAIRITFTGDGEVYVLAR